MTVGKEDEIENAILECLKKRYHQARSKFNRNRNFHRMEKIFCPLTIFKEKVYLKDCLSDFFMSGMVEYLGNGLEDI